MEAGLKAARSDLNGQFSKDDTQTADEHGRGCQTLLVIRKIQIQHLLRWHITHTRMTIIKKKTIASADKDVGKNILHLFLVGL